MEPCEFNTRDWLKKRKKKQQRNLRRNGYLGRRETSEGSVLKRRDLSTQRALMLKSHIRK